MKWEFLYWEFWVIWLYEIRVSDSSYIWPLSFYSLVSKSKIYQSDLGEEVHFWIYIGLITQTNELLFTSHWLTQHRDGKLCSMHDKVILCWNGRSHSSQWLKKNIDHLLFTARTDESSCNGAMLQDTAPIPQWFTVSQPDNKAKSHPWYLLPELESPKYLKTHTTPPSLYVQAVRLRIYNEN